MDFITFDEFKKDSLYEEFIKENPSFGGLKVQVSLGSGGAPVSDVEVLVTKDIGGKKILFFRGVTDESGMVDGIMLPTPTSITDFTNKEFPKHTDYKLSVIDKKNNAIKEFTIDAFGDVKAIQNVNIVPASGDMNG